MHIKNLFISFDYKEVLTFFFCLVPEAGLEPARCCQRGILSPLCLPISPLGRRAHCATHQSGHQALGVPS